MNQDLATHKKKLHGSTKEFFQESLKLAPTVNSMISAGELVTDIKSTSDFSYSASSYALPYVRVVGDAGCFIDPFFSSGVHLALSSALSASVTICASLRGHSDELDAAKWHSAKVTEGYERFRLVVLSAYRQMRRQDEPVLSDFDSDGFDKAFDIFRPSMTQSPPTLRNALTLTLPVIQGTADTSEKLTHTDIAQVLDFCSSAFEPTHPEEREAVLAKVAAANAGSIDPLAQELYEAKANAVHANFTEEEKLVVNHMKARSMLRTEDTMHIRNWGLDVINGMAPRLERGRLGLVAATAS